MLIILSASVNAGLVR